MNNILKTFIAMMLSLSIAGCGSKLTVTPVSMQKKPAGNMESKLPEISPSMKQQGIYFSLPKTAIDTEIPIVVTDFTVGKYYEIFNSCSEFCKGSDSLPEKCLKAEEIADFKIELQRVSVVPSAIPDNAHRYLLNVDRNWLSEISHTMKLTTDGILMSTDNVMENKSAEIGAELLKVAGSIAVLALFTDLSESVEAEAEAEQDWDKVCNEIASLKTVLDTHKAWFEQNNSYIEITVEELKKEQFSHVTDKRLPADVGVLEKAILYYDNKIKAVRKKQNKEWKEHFNEDQQDEYKKAIKATTKIEQDPQNFVLKARVEPIEFKEYNSVPSWDLFNKVEVKIGDEKITRLEPVGSENIYYKFLMDIENGLKIKITPLPPFVFGDTAITDSKKTESESRTLRYRIPAKGEFILSRGEKVYFKTEIGVIQYGPLAYLPVDIGGIKQTVNLSIHPISGGIDSVTVGANPVSTATVKDAATVASDFFDAYKGKDLKELEEKKNKLELEKTILELEKELEKLKGSTD